ncbi:hypothetical protein I8752_34865 [Nostocaceae cyanobacterium CENA369]|uniref:Uncharacterized protein n=1 Tax=Dendronalium phyllosphericum CENA369 TaxID=1725256 RepID=A0A8J7LK16_9NOST|nr:hypothetical protein [Dendronalium phyllosphericum]MBH8578038.1 hypothetical protein [Dendronalium phyllosphericum CENA369]
MLAQFQSLYPNGNLISELVQIFQGKYIVRASVQIEGVTRATGMAAAETVEVAEDQARTRALMVLGITSSPQATVESSPKTVSPQVQSNSDLKTTVGINNTYSSATDRDFGSSETALREGFPTQVSQRGESSPRIGGLRHDEGLANPEGATALARNEHHLKGQWSESEVGSQEISIPPVKEQNIKSDVVTSNTRSASKNDTYNQDLNQSFSLTSDRDLEFDPPAENFDMMADNQLETPLFPSSVASNVTPFTPRSYNSSENVSNLTAASKKKKKAEPVNLSDILAKTDVQIERLGWTKDQGKEHLKKTYGKLGRSLLSEEELLDFLRYLESQPDPVAGF